METVRVGGRKYSDPDVIALIRAGGGLSDPRSLVLTQARKLNERYRSFDATGVTPFKRLELLASLAGLEVTQMSLQRRREESRDAVVILNSNGERKHGQILYNPNRPAGRIAFSIAHEIGHTFFPATSGGARFRELCNSDSREANELERLCDLAASELLMPTDEFRDAVGNEWSLKHVPRLAESFGASFEATAFRLASAHRGTAAAGLLRFRRRKEEARSIEVQQQPVQQRNLFKVRRAPAQEAPEPKYRRQSFHMSDTFPNNLTVRWNKSFDRGSIVYRGAIRPEDLFSAWEPLPNGRNVDGMLEIARAPYQRDDADSEHPDLIFFWVVPS